MIRHVCHVTQIGSLITTYMIYKNIRVYKNINYIYIYIKYPKYLKVSELPKTIKKYLDSFI